MGVHSVVPRSSDMTSDSAAEALKVSRFNIRATAAQKEMIEAAAAATHQNASRFVMSAALDSAEAVLADRTRFVLDEDSWREFERRLDAPARVIPALRVAAARSGPRRGR